MDLSLLMQTNFMARTSLAFACPIIKARPANCKRLFCPRNPKILLDFCDIRLKAEILHRTNANSQKLPHLRRSGVLPRPRRMHNRNRTTNGDPVQRPVGADASVRPLGNYGFAATCRKNGTSPSPTAIVIHCTVSHWRVPICGCTPPGGQGRPPLRVRSGLHRCTRIYGIVRRGRGKPCPYVTTNFGGSCKPSLGIENVTILC